MVTVSESDWKGGYKNQRSMGIIIMSYKTLGNNIIGCYSHQCMTGRPKLFVMSGGVPYLFFLGCLVGCFLPNVGIFAVILLMGLSADTNVRVHSNLHPR